mgnify:CR=1 FL=1
MKTNIIRYDKLSTWDIISLTVYFLISMFILFVGLNGYEFKEHFISIYAFSTPLFLYLINYKSLRNFIVYVIWLIFSLFHIWLYFVIQNKLYFDISREYAVDGLLYIFPFLLYFQLARIVHLKIKNTELVAPSWGGSFDIFDNRNIDLLDYLFFIFFFVIWVIIIPIT